jgi:hypothetical protein
VFGVHIQVATAGLLDQNDQLRAKIQAEEKDKLQSQMALELAAERQRLEDEYALAPLCSCYSCYPRSLVTAMPPRPQPP